MDLNKEELELLADGMNPRYVRDGLDYETAIVTLARFALAVGSLIRLVGQDTKSESE